MRTIGIARARMKIGLANLAYNMRRPSWTACGSVLTLSMPLQGDYWCVVRDAVQDFSLSVCGEPCSVHRYREVVISPPGAPIGDGS